MIRAYYNPSNSKELNEYTAKGFENSNRPDMHIESSIKKGDRCYLVGWSVILTFTVNNDNSSIALSGETANEICKYFSGE